MYAGYLSQPLPPPWRRIYNDASSDGSHQLQYINDITKDVTDIHPFSKYVTEQQLARLDESHCCDVGVTADVVRKVNPETLTEIEGIDRSSVSTEKYSEYKCTWKENDVFDDKSVFGLTIRVQHSDDEALVRFDGPNCCWKTVVLEAPYGPVSRHDLFIGSKIKVYGRNLVISSASRTTCEWIELEHKRLSRRQEKMRVKIEKCGVVPVVQLAYSAPIHTFSREGPGLGGHSDLRKIRRENAFLGEQLVNLGIDFDFRKA